MTMRSSVLVGGVCLLAAACVSPKPDGVVPHQDAAGVQTVDEPDGGEGKDDALVDQLGPIPDAPVDVAAPADTFKPPVCGNGLLEPGEECDPPGSCPTSCPNRGCTQFTLHGSAAACTARCVESGQQTSCTANDGCCPAGCNATSDKDCSIK